MDFYKIREQRTRSGILEVFPDFCATHSKDLMIRGRSFYAIWDPERDLWSTDEYDVQRIIDNDLEAYIAKKKNKDDMFIKTMLSFDSGSWIKYRKFLNNMSDNSHQLDNKILFANDPIKKTDYASKALPYNLEEGPCDAYHELMSTLYTQEERQKLEWAIGAIITGDSKTIQKFIVLYGEGGSGKSTFLNIVQKLFVGYYAMFEAKALVGSSNQFATEVFKNNPLVAIQHDGDLSKIEDNSKLNSIISHEEMTMNEKYKPSYTAKTNCFLFMGTNKPVKITDSHSGMIRRLIDVRPSGNKIGTRRYHHLIHQIDFELGAIAHHCLQVYLKLGKNYYSNYRPKDMILQTNVFFNFVEDSYFTFKERNGTSLKQAYEMYKQHCDETLASFKMPRHVFREELKSYFKYFYEEYRDPDGKHIRNYYYDFLSDKIDGNGMTAIDDSSTDLLTLDCTLSIFDEKCAEYSAQYAKADESPEGYWDSCKTLLKDLDTNKLHYVRVPENHIVIDFDLKDETGQKSKKLNIEAASKWPSTYAEFSKGGNGIHLHYIYDGDVSTLSRVYEEDIEIKVFNGKSSLRRKLSFCNALAIAHISSGLPLKEIKKGGNMLNPQSVKTEKGLRDLIQRNLNKEIHPGTKPSIDFINKILDDAYSSNLSYDVTDMRGKVLHFAMQSTNQSEYCIKLVNKMKFQSLHESANVDITDDRPIVFYDVEVYPNLFIVAWKQAGKEHQKVKMINPSPADIEELLKYRLVGFNNRRYDNHILYGRYLGYSNLELFKLSGKLVGKVNSGLFREAYNLSYTDVYDFSAKKQSLKKWEIELGIKHHEFPYRWDMPLPEDKWLEAADYCGDDVDATEAVWDHLQADFLARQILADLAGGSLNNTTNQLTTKIIFGNERNPALNYTDLSETFPGYEFKQFEDGTWHNMYMGTDIGFGGYVKATPGMYTNVPVLDIESMHPTSAIIMEYFGEYTKNYKDIKDARLAIKHGDLKQVRTMLGGKLNKYLVEDKIDDLSYALKIAINSVYGMSSAKYDNPFRDIRNKNNIVALRGALFMRLLQDKIESMGYVVAHIKTDSIKIPGATPDVIQFCKDFAKEYGYTFEHEATYDKMCLVNDAVFIAKCEWAEKSKKIGKWEATGAQFAQPYLFKTLFSKEPLEFIDFCETKSVTNPAALYLDFNEGLNEDAHNYIFVGKVGMFCPVTEGSGGGLLLREKDGKYSAATGTKGYRWMESEMVKTLNRENDIDLSYFNRFVDNAIHDIGIYGDANWFIGN